MGQIKSITIGFLDNILLLLLCLSLLSPLLPLHLTYREKIALIFLISSIGLLFISVRQLLKSSPETKGGMVLGLLVIFLGYLMFQLLPLPVSLLHQFSEARSLIGQTNAYGLRGYFTVSLDLSSTIWFVMLFFSYIVIYLLTVLLSSNKTKFLVIFTLIFLLGIYQIIFDMVSKELGYFYINKTEIDGHSYRLTGTFINSNNLSALINLSFAAGLALLSILVYQFKLTNRIWSLTKMVTIVVGLFVLLYGSIQSGSAGGFLALVAAIGLTGVLLLMKNLNLKRLLLFTSFFVGIILLLVFFGGREINLDQLTSQLTLSGRPALWAAVINMWQDFPVFGVGAGAFEWVFPGYKTDVLSPLRVVNAHSSYLHMLAETGLVGLTILLSLLLVFLKNVVALVRYNSRSVYLVAALMIGWLAFIIHEAVENSFLLPSVAGPFICLMALVMYADRVELVQRKLK